MESKPDEEIQHILVQLESERLIDHSFIEKLAKAPNLMQQIAERWGEQVYSSLLKALTHKTFSPDLAKQYWQAINQHRYRLSQQLKRDPGIAVAALDYLTNIAREIQQPAIIEFAQLNQIANFATKDELTGLYVRKIFENALEQHVSEAKRYQFELCLLMADIDDFKIYNDTYGHQAGDMVLKRIGEIILSTIRDSDIAARYGGEELAIIAPKTSLHEACSLAERLRKNVAKGFDNEPATTISIGIAQLAKEQTSDELVKAADQCLYQAKERGKNQCVS